MSLQMPSFARRAINALPDVSDQPKELQAFAGVFGSLVVHLLLLVLWILLQDGWMDQLLSALPKREVPIEIVIQTTSILPEREVVPLDQLKERDRIDSEGLAKASAPPKQPSFQSDQDLEAGSLQKPKGTSALPQNNARREVVDRALVQREARAGSMEGKTQSPPNIPRLASKTSDSRVVAASKKKSPQPQPGAASSPVGDLDDLGGELVFRKVASGISAPVKVIERLGSGKKAKAVEDTPEDLLQEGKQQSKTDGGLDQNGKLGVNASKTPLAAYMKSVSRAIGARWNMLIKNRMDSLETGSVKVRFRVAADGTVQEVVLEASSANREFSDLCLDVVRAAELDPPPPEAAPLLKGGLLEIPFTFSLY